MYISKAEREKYKSLLQSDNKILEDASSEDDIKVEVDGETILDTSTPEENQQVEMAKTSEVPQTDVDMIISESINNLIKDEIEAIDGYMGFV